LAHLATRPGHEETTDALKRALGAVRQGMPTPARVESLGEGDDDLLRSLLDRPAATWEDPARV
ncbi:hypothetical protein ACWGBH_33635, partial [Streptomyces massasporeus]